ncbi:MAG TPA: zinc ribbon domain-containing protein [Pyrinomonadaceae bacterium]|jgi:hypothetical protein
MYCPTCGAECQPGLNFCNRCGTPVGGTVVKQELVPVDLRSPVRVLGVTITLTTVIYLAILFIGLAGLASWHIDEGVIAAIGVVGLLVLFGLDLALIRLLSRLLGAAPEKRRLTLPLFGKSDTPPTRELYGQPQYAAPLPEGVPSVTEHTTRTFSPVYREPRG